MKALSFCSVLVSSYSAYCSIVHPVKEHNRQGKKQGKGGRATTKPAMENDHRGSFKPDIPVASTEKLSAGFRQQKSHVKTQGRETDIASKLDIKRASPDRLAVQDRNGKEEAGLMAPSFKTRRRAR